MDRQRILQENARALAAAGLTARTEDKTLEEYAKSRDPRVAAAARAEIQRTEALPLEEHEGYELPPETKPLDEQTEAQRKANAVDLTQDVKCAYDE